MAKVFVTKRGCWLWQGKRNQAGYGIITIDKKELRVHRVLYELEVGPIPYGLQLDHLCRRPPCCNPDHLEPVTGAMNMNRTRGLHISPKRRNGPKPSDRQVGQGAHNSVKTHCPRGHEYTEENTKTYRNKAGSVQRFCRACDRERAHRRPSRAKDPN